MVKQAADRWMPWQIQSGEILGQLISGLDALVVVFVDLNGIIQSWHPAVEKTFGYAEAEFVGQSLNLLMPAGRRLEPLEASRPFVVRSLAKRGGALILVEESTIALHDREQTTAGFAKVFRDITIETHASTKLHGLARALDQAIVVIRCWDGTIEHWTAGSERLYQWSASEAVGSKCQDLLRAVYRQSLDSIHEELLETGTWRGEIRHQRRDGTNVWVLADWVLLTDDGGDQPSVVETNTDVTAITQLRTEHEAAKQQAEALAAELERSNIELEEFARIASHDLSAPITTARWLAEVLSMQQGQYLDDKGREWLAQISAALSRMANLTEAILDHARVGKAAIRSQTAVDTGEALTHALSNLKKEIDASNADISWQAMPKLYVQREGLIRLFQNLFSNAIKYRRADVPLLVAVRSQRQGDKWIVSVTDNGSGIEPDWLERIFKPMQRQRERADIPGSGIGLATCKKIVERAGGRIWAESQPDQGATFLIELPARN